MIIVVNALLQRRHLLLQVRDLLLQRVFGLGQVRELTVQGRVILGLQFLLLLSNIRQLDGDPLFPGADLPQGLFDHVPLGKHLGLEFLAQPLVLRRQPLELALQPINGSRQIRGGRWRGCRCCRRCGGRDGFWRCTRRRHGGFRLCWIRLVRFLFINAEQCGQRRLFCLVFAFE